MDNDLYYLSTFATKSETKSIDIMRINLYGLISAVILSKTIFKRNSEISVFLELVNITVKDYVMKSRTLLLSRIIRDIEKMDADQLKKIQKETVNYLFSIQDIQEVTSKKNKRNSIDDVLEKFGRGE
ncbi:hypothetical protein HRG49_04305 [Enterococcus faecalis]|uniref:hypothetical protein n=1 Tax=Enterococcus TaxID=1350 RepID=UPI00128AE515|nr:MULTISPECIES: hypothetical protein [Enterococcus]EHZ9205067.1 hypothetical protein [Enterococcus faecalis]NST52950.1 hypothetical protein [Enterococcus faecalis]HAP5656033.1 hypothetical protein [Enterococcus faecalis]HDT8185925.1 hypothetical protein [Enterococcus faecalis]HDT8201027.1 hypothetical protein [Enterococcus faecalis]